MKTASTILIAGSALLSAAAGGAAFAAPTSASNMTCSQFLALDDVTKPKVVFWAEGLNKSGRPESAVIDVDSVNRIVPVVIDACTQNPNASFMNSVKSSSSRAR
jgi:acid stress chaperone HdeA